MGADYHCFALDTPGFGQSFQPAAIPDLQYPARLLLEAIEALGVSEFHLCGHHTGGCIAVEMPAITPISIKSLSIIGPVLVTEERQEYMKTFVKPFETEESGEFHDSLELPRFNRSGRDPRTGFARCMITSSPIRRCRWRFPRSGRISKLSIEGWRHRYWSCVLKTMCCGLFLNARLK